MNLFSMLLKSIGEIEKTIIECYLRNFLNLLVNLAKNTFCDPRRFGDFLNTYEQYY